MKINVLSKSNINEEKSRQIQDLFQQLSLTKEQLRVEEIIDGLNPIILVYCEVDNKIEGIASMCVYKVISGNKGWIEDVVVNSKIRGKGIGRKLIEKLLLIGKEKGLSEVLLFTEKHRIPAIDLYKSLGFIEKDSDIYELKM